MFIELRNASKTLSDGQQILRCIELQIDRGEVIAIVGRSGSGKSTLLAGLGMLAPFDNGTDYVIDGREVHAMGASEASRFRSGQVGFVLQNSGLIDHLSSLQNVMVPFMHGRSISITQARHKAEIALKSVGLELLRNRRPSRLSGGERQRVAIARAIVMKPSLILADEPTGALDGVTGALVLEEMLQLVRNQRSALVLVTHDPEVAARADRTYSLVAGALHPIDPAKSS